jgi:hypothetical protein
VLPWKRNSWKNPEVEERDFFFQESAPGFLSKTQISLSQPRSYFWAGKERECPETLYQASLHPKEPYEKGGVQIGPVRVFSLNLFQGLIKKIMLFHNGAQVNH